MQFLHFSKPLKLRYNYAKLLHWRVRAVDFTKGLGREVRVLQRRSTSVSNLKNAHLELGQNDPMLKQIINVYRGVFTSKSMIEIFAKIINS